MESLCDYNFLFQAQALLVSKQPEMFASLATYAKIISCWGRGPNPNPTSVKMCQFQGMYAHMGNHIRSM